MADTLLLKLTLTPLLIGAASLAGRRWGPAVSGWFVGLPLTSGPIALFLALEHGAGFAAAAAVGALAGALAEVAFCLAYAATARRGWPMAIVAASVAFAVVAGALQPVALSLAVTAVGVYVALTGAVLIVPRPPQVAATRRPPAWDLPARMAIATTIVLLITGAATALGARLSGVLATFPAYAAILAIFAHRESASAATAVLRGLLLGLFGFAGFFVVLAALLEQLGVGIAFVLASAATLAIQAASLVMVVAGPTSGRLGRMLAGR